MNFNTARQNFGHQKSSNITIKLSAGIITEYGRDNYEKAKQYVL